MYTMAAMDNHVFPLSTSIKFYLFHPFPFLQRLRRRSAVPHPLQSVGHPV